MTSRLVGTDAVIYARTHWPDLLPQLYPITVKAPVPPMLDTSWDEQAQVDFLVEAYTSFGMLHCPQAVWTQHRIQALAARKGEGRAAAEYAKLAAAAKIMCGQGWGELEETVDGGKLPREIAPHSWLLWSMGARVGVMKETAYRPQGGYPAIGSIFAPGRLLQSKTLRVYSHTSADLSSGAARAGDTWANREGIGAAYAAMLARQNAIYVLGFDSRETCGRAADSLGACLGGKDLRELDALERGKAAAVELRLAKLAEAGTWVWGCWLQSKAQGRAAHVMQALAG